MNKNIKLKKSSGQIKSYLLVFIIGIIAGVITRLTDFFPYDTLWSFSSIATLLGFWIVTVTFIVYFSSTNINAALNTFLYLFGMTLSFYALLYILGFWLPKFDNGSFKTSLFLIYSAVSFVAGIVAYFLYYWNKHNKLGSIMYALPVGGLLAETIGVALYFINNHTFLFQLIFDLLFLGIFGIWFYKKASNKIVFLAAIITVGVLGYFLIYRV